MPTGETAKARIPVTPSTHELLKERKDDKETYDKVIRDLLKGER